MNSIRAVRAWRGLTLSVVLFLLQTPASQSAPSGDSERQVSVRISAARALFKPGDDVPLHVEIWNESGQDLFICKNIAADVSNALAKIDLSLYHGTQREAPVFTLVADSFSSKRSSYPPLAGEISKYWIALPPRHFYGGEVIMRASWFKKLAVPGRYRIQGKYTSRGFLAEDINNPLLHYTEELKQLPFKAWVGEAETNSIWIEISAKTNRSSVGPSH